MRNTLVSEALKQYCQEALGILKDDFEELVKTSTMIRPKVEVTGPGTLSHSYVRDIMWPILVVRFDAKFKDMESYKEAARALENDKTISRHLGELVGTSDSRSRIDVENCLRSLLIQLLQEQQSTEFQKGAFEKIYTRMEDFFYEDVLEYRIVAPLVHFKMEADRLELGDRFSVMKIPKEEMEKMLSEAQEISFFMPYRAWPAAEYALELYVETKKVIAESDLSSNRESASQVSGKTFEEVCSALRLFKKGAVGYDHIRMQSMSWSPHGGFLESSPAAGRSLFGGPYTLAQDELQSFRAFWEAFQRARRIRRNRIEIALRRFNFGYERVRPDDRLIDFLIAFEALFLKASERQELEYRLALRGSALLGDNQEERKRVFNQLKMAYQERSNIVHGGATKQTVRLGSQQVQLSEFVDGLEDLLRSAIRKFLLLCENQSEAQIISGLDEKIVTGS